MAGEPTLICAMGQLLNYFREHRWQRRIVTVSLIAILAAVATMLAYPHVQDWLLIRDLGGDDTQVRERAIRRAVARGAKSPRTLRRLEDALSDENELRFASVVTALRHLLAGGLNSPRTLRRLEDALSSENERRFVLVVRALRDLGEFEVPRREGLHRDRIRAIEIEQSRSETQPQWAAESREILVVEAVLCGRDNPFIRRALAAAVADPAAKVRVAAALLAARLGDDESLSRLLDDKFPAVAAAAALDAGIARRKRHADRIRRLLESSDDLECRSAAAYALAKIDPAGSSELLRSFLANARDAALRDRLLHVMGVLGGDRARDGVLGILRVAEKAKKPPPAAALIAAGKLRIVEAKPAVLDILARAAGDGSGVYESHLLAALEAADTLKLPVRRQVHDICRKLWSPRLFLTMTAAVRILATQADLPQPQDANAPSRNECMRTLRRAAVFARQPASQPAGVPPVVIDTPLASAAAAVALWRLKGPAAEQFVRSAAAATTTLPGDYIAWHLAKMDAENAFELGLQMLPPRGAPPAIRVYNKNERSAGAMMLAMSAASEKQKRSAVERISSHLAGGEDDFYVKGAYECALLMLGRDDMRRTVHGLLEVGEFPQRRVITALCAVGDRKALDWLLWNPQISPDDVVSLLTVRGIGEVLAATSPKLPRVDVAAEENLQLWQVRILRDTYAIGRANVSLGLKR